MANPHRGEVALVAGDQTYTLVYTTNSLCELEESLGQSIEQIVNNMNHFKVRRAVVWAGLMKHHKMSITEAGDVMDAAGVPATVEAVEKAITAAFPPPPEAKAKNK